MNLRRCLKSPFVALIHFSNKFLDESGEGGEWQTSRTVKRDFRAGVFCSRGRRLSAVSPRSNSRRSRKRRCNIPSTESLIRHCLYVGERNARVPRPAKELKGFVKVFLRPGETKRVTFVLDGRAFSCYDVASKRWRAEPGEFDVYLGRSSAQIELRDKLTLPARGMAAGQ